MKKRPRFEIAMTATGHPGVVKMDGKVLDAVAAVVVESSVLDDELTRITLTFNGVHVTTTELDW